MHWNNPFFNVRAAMCRNHSCRGRCGGYEPGGRHQDGFAVGAGVIQPTEYLSTIQCVADADSEDDDEYIVLLAIILVRVGLLHYNRIEYSRPCASHATLATHCLRLKPEAQSQGG